jgi:hypothetical protein
MCNRNQNSTEEGIGSRKSELKKALGLVLIGVGIILTFCNLIGIFIYTTVEKMNPCPVEISKQNISEEQFWNKAYRKSNEPIKAYVDRLTGLVSDRMILIDPKFTQPTFFENWILWIYSQYKGQYEWIDSKKAIRLGGGFCSQHAIVFNNILREQNIESRILSLNGHVLNEVLIDGKWRVYDPDFNVIFDESLKELEDNSNRVYRAYWMAGRTHEESTYLEMIFASHEDNWHFSTSKHFAIKNYIIETVSIYLIWVIPILLIIIGFIIQRSSMINRQIIFKI